MRTEVADELFSLREIAVVAGVAARRVRDEVARRQIVVVNGLLSAADAVRLVRELSGTPLSAADRSPLASLTVSRRRTAVPLALSGFAHGLLLAAIVAGLGFGLLSPPERDPAAPSEKPVRLIYVIAAGPGGGGGGGLQLPAPPPPDEAPKVETPIRKTETPAPPVRRRIPPPPPRPVRTLAMARAEDQRTYVPRPAPPAVQAPIVQTAARVPDPAGVPSLPPSKTVGTGSGSGEGPGLGPGTGGGTGGGPFRPGSGVDPPSLLKEVKPTYTDEARRRSIEGDVVLEIIVLSSGRVGSVTVVRRLGAGLDDRAVQAVRQWQFSPARRQGVPVDVVVEVSVGFTLR